MQIEVSIIIDPAEKFPSRYNVSDSLFTSLSTMSLFNLTCKDWLDEGFTEDTWTEDEPLFYLFFLQNGTEEEDRQILHFERNYFNVKGQPSGSVAQLAECSHGMREALGSSPNRAPIFSCPLTFPPPA